MPLGGPGRSADEPVDEVLQQLKPHHARRGRDLVRRMRRRVDDGGHGREQAPDLVDADLPPGPRIPDSKLPLHGPRQIDQDGVDVGQAGGLRGVDGEFDPDQQGADWELPGPALARRT